jgi:hypothetical protein
MKQKVRLAGIFSAGLLGLSLVTFIMVKTGLNVNAVTAPESQLFTSVTPTPGSDNTPVVTGEPTVTPSITPKPREDDDRKGDTDNTVEHKLHNEVETDNDPFEENESENGHAFKHLDNHDDHGNRDKHDNSATDYQINHTESRQKNKHE